MIESTLARDPFFREFFRDNGRSDGEVAVVFAPRMNVAERPEAYDVVLEIPGMTKDDINIEVNEGRLAIWGEKKTERDERDKKVHVREISFGAFRRELSLPEDVQEEKIEAAYDNGQLKLTLPREDKKRSARRVALA